MKLFNKQLWGLVNLSLIVFDYPYNGAAEGIKSVEKEKTLKSLFGTWKTKKTAQELKDESRSSEINSENLL